MNKEIYLVTNKSLIKDAVLSIDGERSAW